MEKEVPEKQTNQRSNQISPSRSRTRKNPFKVPGKQQQLIALGSLVNSRWIIKNSLLAIIDQFAPVKTPQPGDNLYQFQDKGQTFPQFASSQRNFFYKEKQIIYIATFYCKASQKTISRVRSCAKAFFHPAKIKLHEFPKTDLSKFEPIQGPNGQIYYNAAKMNAFFAKNLPKNTFSIAIITNLLIYNGGNPRKQIEEKWVFGLGSMKARTCVISFQQIIVKGFGGKRQKNQEDQSQTNQKFLIRVVNHELCHTFAMKHCIFYRCLMNGSNHYQEAVSKDQHLCPVCLRKLQFALKFDFAQRYQSLGDEKSLILAEKIRKNLALNSK